MLIDAERIDREVRGAERLNTGAMNAVFWHDPERGFRIRDDYLAALSRPMPTMTDAELIAYALQQQRRVKGQVS